MRKAQIAEEFHQARVAAAAAKAGSRNRDKQKDAGRIIGQLKQEMARLGMTDAELEALIALKHGCGSGDGSGSDPPQEATAGAAADAATGVGGATAAVATGQTPT